MLAEAEKVFKGMTPTRSFPLPDPGRVKFYVLTFSGTFTADVAAPDLTEGQHQFSALFFAGQELSAKVQEHFKPYLDREKSN
jgi:hypothetical protein